MYAVSKTRQFSGIYTIATPLELTNFQNLTCPESGNERAIEKKNVKNNFFGPHYLFSNLREKKFGIFFGLSFRYRIKKIIKIFLSFCLLFL